MKVNHRRRNASLLFRTLFLLLILLPSSSLYLCELSSVSREERVSLSAGQISTSNGIKGRQEDSHSAPTSSPLSTSTSTKETPSILVNSQASVQSFKTPAGVVKCSCQTVSETENVPDEREPTGKTIEIEIHESTEVEVEEDGSNEGKKEMDSDSASASEIVQLLKPITLSIPKVPVRNSFTLDDDVLQEDEEGAISFKASEDRVLDNSEERPSFFSFLTSFYKNDEAMGDESVSYDGNKQPGSKPTSSSYKAYRSSELSSDQEKLEEGAVNGNEERLPYFNWDFIYGHNQGPSSSLGPSMSPGLKKRPEFLYLGSTMNSFKGPRRRRRRRSLIGDRGQNAMGGTPRLSNPSTVFVYPVGYHSQSANADLNSTNQEEPTVHLQIRQETFIPAPNNMDKEELKKEMEAAMHRAWSDYGPNGIHSFKYSEAIPPPPPPPPEAISDSSTGAAPLVPVLKQNSDPGPVSPIDVALPPHQQISPYHVQLHQPYYRPPRPFLFIDRIFNPFQPMNSEWDKHVNVLSRTPVPPPEPGPFSRFLASYIDFEVNNHEQADLMRRVVFSLFVGLLIVGWIFLGVAVGAIPLKKWLAFKTVAEEARKDSSKDILKRDATLSDLTDKILLSLDADWLKRLEERVMGTDKRGNSPAKRIPIQVFCCILPQEQANGMVECQVSKSVHNGGANKKGAGGGKKGTFKCISDLIYNFQFGPKEDGVGTEPDNAVNFKGKANHDLEGNNINDTLITT